MIGTFVIWVEDRWGNIVRAFTWTGAANEGIAKAKAESQANGMYLADVWATPVANNNKGMWS
jgi:hypothetical protein